MSAALRLHIGGQVRAAGWTVVDALPGPAVDIVGDIRDLGFLRDGAAVEIYASHVLEHLDYQGELPRALAECRRVLAPGGLLKASVPDLVTLSSLIADGRTTPDERFALMRMLFGGQTDAFDYHKVGLDYAILGGFLMQAGFSALRRVADFGLFADSSRLAFKGVPISLNIEARA